MIKRFAAVFLLLACGSPLAAQNKYDFAQFGAETGRFFTQPARWDGRSWLTLGAAGAGTLAVGHYDRVIQEDAFEHTRYSKKLPVQLGEQWGGYFVTPALAAGLLAHGWLRGDEGTKKMGFEIGQSLIYASVITEVIKNVAGRSRPHLRRGTGSYKPFSLNKYNWTSFPAGHVDAAFALSTVFSRSVEAPWLKALLYAPAGLTVASRIYKNQHWASDCVFGAVVGYYAADWVMDRHEKMGADRASGPAVSPYLAGDAAGVLVALKL